MKKLLLIVALGFAVTASAQVSTFQNVKVNTSFQITTGPKITAIKLNFADTLSINDDRLVTLKAINTEISRRLGLLFNYINTADEIPTDGTIETVGGLTRVAPGVTKENFRRVTTQSFTIAATDVNIMYDYPGGGGTVTLPSLNVDTHNNIYIIKNPTAGTLTFNNAVWTDNATSTTTLAAGRWVKLHVDNDAAKIWIVAGGAL